MKRRGSLGVVTMSLLAIIVSGVIGIAGIIVKHHDDSKNYKVKHKTEQHQNKEEDNGKNT